MSVSESMVSAGMPVGPPSAMVVAVPVASPAACGAAAAVPSPAARLSKQLLLTVQTS